MKNFALVLISSCILFASCQKEDTYPPLNSGTLLIKSISVLNGETSTTNYSYTANNEIDVISTIGTSGGADVGDYRKFYRDANGRIIRIANKVPSQDGIEVDTVYMYVHYPDATTFNYDYTVQKIAIDTYEFNDSTLYTYNSSNQITQSYTYETGDIFDIQEIKAVYTYDASGNVVKLEGYNNLTGTMQLSVTFDMIYDDKINPLSSDKQAMLISRGAPGSSYNNITIAKFTDVTEPHVQTITNTYTYGPNGLPQTLVSVDDSDNSTTTTTFYYNK